MRKHVVVYFKYEDLIYSIMVKGSVEELSLSLVEERIRKKVGLVVQSGMKLRLSYIPVVLGSSEELRILDDEDLCVYLTSGDKVNGRCILNVELVTSIEPLRGRLMVVASEQLSRVGKLSSTGMNYDEHHCNDDGNLGNAIIRLHSNDDENLGNAITQFEENEEVAEQNDEMPNIVEEDEDIDNNTGGSDLGVEEYIQPTRSVEPARFMQEWEDGLGFVRYQEFPNKKTLQELVDRCAFVNCFGYVVKNSDRNRFVVRCRQENCNWRIRATRIRETDIFTIKRYEKMHTCSRASQSDSNQKRKGTPELVASVLNDDYPGQLDTPSAKCIMDLVQTKLGVKISYSTALRGKNKAVSDLRGSPEESYKLLYQYLYMLEKVNVGTVTRVEVDENNKFKYLFIALGASIEGFQVMRKVITVDATFLKKGYGGVLVFATAQDPNRHHYPIAFGVLDGENNASWLWFFENLKSVVPDSEELVFMSDRNASLISAVANVYPRSHHAYCIWHLSQNVKNSATNVNRDVVAWRFMECSKLYTVAEFESAYSSFKSRFPSAAKYVEETTLKEKWARCWFPGEKYNIDTSNSVESLNSVFRAARRYSLIPLIDTIVKKISEWFNDHRKEAASGSSDRKLVPLVENYLHDTWSVAEKLKATELNSYELEYNVVDSDGRSYFVSLLSRSCSCRVFDIERYPCVHAIAAFIENRNKRPEDRCRDVQLHELCTKYYWAELWALAYYKTIYVVPDMSEWNVPDNIKQLHIQPPDVIKRKGRKKTKRFPSAGERRPRTKNKRCARRGLRWLFFGEDSQV